MDNEQPNNGGSSLRLPQLWAENTEAWFAIAETRFRIKRVDDQQEIFDNVVNALPKESLRTVLDLITDPPEDDPYQQLKDCLCQSHQLTEFQCVEKLHQLDSLGEGSRLSLLHEMAELCPTGHEDSPFFLFLFMQQLPKELRIVLGEVDDHEDIRAMDAKADKLWSLHNHQQHGVVASVDPGSSSSQPPATIAAVKSGPLARGGRSGGQHGKGRGRGGAVATAAAKSTTAATPSAVVTPDSMARASSGLCYFHWWFGDGATRCEGVCSWQGN
jgi:hypothetical protein